MGLGEITKADSQLWQDAYEHWGVSRSLHAELVQGGVLNVPAKRLQKRQIGWHALGFRCIAPQDDGTIVGSTQSDLLQEARLANPWFSSQEQRMSLSVPGGFIVVHGQCQLLLSAHDGSSW